MAQPKKFATFHWAAAASQTVVVKDGPGTLHTVYTHLDENGGFPGAGLAGLTYHLFDNAASASGALILGQYASAAVNPDAPDRTFAPFELDFTNGLVIKLNSGGTSIGSVTVIYS